MPLQLARWLLLLCALRIWLWGVLKLLQIVSIIYFATTWLVAAARRRHFVGPLSVVFGDNG